MQEVVKEKKEDLRLLEFDLSEYSGKVLAPPRDVNEVHVWFAQAPGDTRQFAKYRSMLSSDELDRAARFRFEPDRQNFVFAHGVLRTLLSAYLGTAAGDLRFQYSEHGKPSLVSPSSAGLQFNLSHTFGAVLLGVCRNRDIGVDIERVRDDFDWEGVVAQYFSEGERRSLMRLTEPERTECFFQNWTRKEALLKARGDGLSFPLELLDPVAFDDAEGRFEATPVAPDAQCWWILSLNVPMGYAAAMALSRLSCARTG